MSLLLAMTLALAAPASAAAPTPPLAPGRYAGTSAEGRVDLTLYDDGRAVFGGAALRWRAEGAIIVLRAPGGGERRLVVERDDAGAAFTDPTLGRVQLRPLPAIEPVRAPAPVRPLAWIGAWRHRASGGELALRLRADGRYEMQQDGADPQGGAWQAVEGTLVLTPDGGPPLGYRARLEGGALVVGGGDLPVEVRFSADGPR